MDSVPIMVDSEYIGSIERMLKAAVLHLLEKPCDYVQFFGGCRPSRQFSTLL